MQMASPQLTQQPTASKPAVSATVAESALVPSTAGPAVERILQMNAAVSRLPVEVDVAVPIRKFRVRNLLTLSEGSVIASQWVQGDDLPLSAPGAQLAWTEFEVIDQRLAVRITRLA